MSWKCPCGCALQLSPKDLAKELWLAELAGAPTGNAARISLSPQAERPRPVDPELEPVPGICRGCRKRMSMPTYLVAWLLRWGAEWPVCFNCPSLGRNP